MTTEMILAGVALVIALGALFQSVRASNRLRVLDRHVATAEGDGVGLTGTVAGHGDQLRDLRSDLMVVHDNTQLLRRMAQDAVSHLGLVRYDAFDDLSGAMSFSLALLDERGDGAVVTAIAGRSEGRMYAKAIVGGRCELALSDEERTAVERAVSGTRGEVVVESDRARRRARAS